MVLVHNMLVEPRVPYTPALG